MLPIIANISAFILAVYLSIGRKSKKFKIVIWLITLVITMLNIYLIDKEQKQPKPFVDALIPHISSVEAYNTIKNTFKNDLSDFELIDVIGSSYICLYKPDKIFHRFPEWVFVFRSKLDNHLIEYRVSDNRLPNPPKLDVFQNINYDTGQFAYYMIPRKGFFEFSDKKLGQDYGLNSVVLLMDDMGRMITRYEGSVEQDNIIEAGDGINTIVLARVQIAGRATDYTRESTSVIDTINNRTIVIRKSTIKSNIYHNKLPPIVDWKIDADRALEIATKKGAKGFFPGQEQYGGHPTVRLTNKSLENLKGNYWDIPYVVDGIRHLQIDASTGKLYALNNKGEYSTEWEPTLDGIFNTNNQSNINNAKDDFANNKQNTSTDGIGNNGMDSNSKLIPIAKLSKSQHEIVNLICEDILVQYFINSKVEYNYYKLNYLPNSGAKSLHDAPNGIKLKKPIILISASRHEFTDKERIIMDLSNAVKTAVAEREGTKYRLVDTSVYVFSYNNSKTNIITDNVIIVPQKLAIYN